MSTSNYRLHYRLRTRIGLEALARGEEIWVDLREYKGDYQLSNFGRVRSKEKTYLQKNRFGTYSLRTYPSRILSQFMTGGRNHNYCSIGLTRLDGKVLRAAYIHRLVLETFVGPCPPGMQCRHLDGNSQNNRLDNLCWGTPKEDAEDKRRHGTLLVGSKNHASKLSYEIAEEMRRLYATGDYKQSDIASMFGVTQSAVSAVVLRLRWSEPECH